MFKKSIFKSLLVAIATLSIISCSKEIPVDIITFDKKVLVLNQGNFTEHSASLSLYDEVTGTMQNRVYETANGVSIGATIVSAAISPTKEAYLVCNNPDKIEIIDPQTAKTASTPITSALESPRNTIITNNRIYVSNWGYEYSVLPSGFWEYNKSYIAVYDLATKALIKKVPAGTDAEGMVIFGNRLFVAVKEGVRVFDISNDNFSTIATVRPAGVTGAAKHLVFDGSAMIWASFPDKGIVRIDPVYLFVNNVVEVPVDYMDGYITTDAYGTQIYTYNTTFNASYMPEEASIYTVNSQNGTVRKLFTGTYFYGLGVSPSTGNIFTAEVSFTSNSLMKVVGADGNLKSSAPAGVGTFRYMFF